VVHVVEQVVQNGPVRILADKVHAAGNSAGGVDGLIGPQRIAMDVHENVPLDPGVGAVEVQAIVARAVKDVIDNLQNRAGPIAASEVDGVVEAPGVPEIVVAEDPVTPGVNAVDAVQALRTGRRRIAGEDTVLDDEGTAVEGNVFDDGCGRPGAVINEDDRTAVDMQLRVVPVGGSRTAAAIEINVGQAALHRRIQKVEAGPHFGTHLMPYRLNVGKRLMGRDV